MTTTAVVTGGAGFVGRHLVAALARADRRVRVLDVRRPDAPVEDVRYVRGTVTDGELVGELVAGADRLFHLAARTDLWAPDPAAYEEVNRRGTRTVLEAALERGVDRVVHVSTEAVLRDWGEASAGAPSPSIEEVPDPDAMPGPYCRSKALGEREVRAAARRGLPVTVVNPTVPVGPGDPGETPPGRMLLGYLDGELPAYTAAELDLIDVRDLSRGLMRAAERGEVGRRYVLGGRRLRLRRLLELLEEITGLEMPRLRVPYPVSLAAAVVGQLLADHVTGRRPSASVEGVRLSRAPSRFDGRRSRAELGLELRALRTTLEETVEWLERGGHLRRDLAR